jgi:hypothetical protein
MKATLSDASMRCVKRKLKRGPRFSRKELAAYTLGLMEGEERKFHHPWHTDKPGERPCRPEAVPRLVVELLEVIPHEAVASACGTLGHPSFWLRPGYRYRCVCGEISYKD